ncbi:imidazolonepropionase [Xanthovirga aplysinae]|uniref:imidazolonepropionase n=1 Tax=Xanthovirga aplysinae TaxID=2529853 RepID=UPI0012BBC910|nr:imidazolonepropionase [Xanthovirga aplysinae]MTI31491.1 imidazolonepropionase [Xanthovirga aplysinae]
METLKKSRYRLIGPFTQVLTMDHLPLKGALADEDLEVIYQAGILINGDKIVEIGDFIELEKEIPALNGAIEYLEEDYVLMPGLVDSHTHICFGGSRARDYAMRVAGKSYLEIARSGGGIWDTVTKTREASLESLKDGINKRAHRLLKEGVTTCEVKSGYALNVVGEIKMLHAIKEVNDSNPIDLISTCLAAHMPPKDFNGVPEEYLQQILEVLLPEVKKQELAKRVDIFIEESAFSTDEAVPYLKAAKEMGFSITVHADQFSTGGSEVAIEVGAVSADHLEASSENEIELLAMSDVVATALPGASLGLGCAFTPGRKLLDHGGCLAIASDWNPGSAPMGDLLMQAAVYGAVEKLSMAETLAGITVRAAHALEVEDRGVLSSGKIADFIAFPTHDFREILYQQGKLKPSMVWKNGKLVKSEK